MILLVIPNGGDANDDDTNDDYNESESSLGRNCISLSLNNSMIDLQNEDDNIDI